MELREERVVVSRRTEDMLSDVSEHSEVKQVELGCWLVEYAVSVIPVAVNICDNVFVSPLSLPLQLQIHFANHSTKSSRNDIA